MNGKSASLVAGCHRFAIELYNTNTEHDVIISLEMVATGHAQTSQEGTKVRHGAEVQFRFSIKLTCWSVLDFFSHSLVDEPIC